MSNHFTSKTQHGAGASRRGCFVGHAFRGFNPPPRSCGRKNDTLGFMIKSLSSLALLSILVSCATSKRPEYKIGDSPKQDRSSAEQILAEQISQLSSPQYDTPPRAISTQIPVYPQKWRNLGIAGSVVTTFTVGTDGNVSNPSVLGSPSPDLTVLVLHAIMQWTFKPALKNGVPVAARLRQEIKFEIK